MKMYLCLLHRCAVFTSHGMAVSVISFAMSIHPLRHTVTVTPQVMNTLSWGNTAVFIIMWPVSALAKA